MSVNFIDRQQHERSSLEEYQRKVRFKQVKFCIFLVSIQLALLCLFVRFCVYSLHANASVAENGIAAEFGGGAGRMDQGHIQMVITFLIVSATVLLGIDNNQINGEVEIPTFSIVTLGYQWSILCRGIFFVLYQDLDEIRIDVHDLTEAFLAQLSLLISLEFVLGKIAPLNLLSILILHVPTFTACKLINEELLLVTDPGSTLTINLFSTVYGLSLQLISLRPTQRTQVSPGRKRLNTSASGISSLLFISLPVINSITSESDSELTRAFVNTVLGGVSCYVAFSTLTSATNSVKGSTFKALSSQSAMRSGGIAVGSVATLMIRPFGAIAIGMFAGLVSATSLLFLEPYFQKRFSLPHSNGLLSFNGFPAAISGLVGILMAALSEEVNGVITYHMSLYPIYPGRVPSMDLCTEQHNCQSMGAIISNYPFLEEKAQSRSASDQAIFQALGLLLPLALGSIVGAINGLIIRISAQRCGNDFPTSLWCHDNFRNSNEMENTRSKAKIEEQETML